MNLGWMVFSIQGKFLVLGDLHLGMKKFNIDWLDNQVSFFDKQVVPYMKENKIKYIIQLGDLFDNRTTVDLLFMKELKTKFFDSLKDNDIVLITLVGNHDIYHKENRDTTLLEHYSSLYPSTFIVIGERDNFNINGQNCRIIPWITKDETISSKELIDVDYLFGHFEIRDFEMVVGHKDVSSELDVHFFKKANLKGVFSGHYHIRNNYDIVTYLGTPYQLNWGDTCLQNGFEVFDEDFNREFVLNTTSQRFIKLVFVNGMVTINDDDVSTHSTDGIIGLLDLNTLDSKHTYKCVIKSSEDDSYNKILNKMKDLNYNFKVLDEQQIKEIVGDVDEIEVVDEVPSFIIDNAPDDEYVKTMLINIINEIKATVDDAL